MKYGFNASANLIGFYEPSRQNENFPSKETIITTNKNFESFLSKPTFSLTNSGTLARLNTSEIGSKPIYDIEKITPTISPEMLANDLLYDFKQRNCFTQEYYFRGNKNKKESGYDNFLCQLKIFDRMVDHLKKHHFSVTQRAWTSSGNEYYGEGQEKVGFIVVLS